jgi:ubiquinone biosynthesis protein
MARHARLDRVRAELETRGLIRSRRRRRAGSAPHGGPGERLADALTASGPLFALFGRYLAGRTDCLPLIDCRALENTRIPVNPTPMIAVGELLAACSGGPVADHFSAFDESRKTTILHQWHDAELADGTPVTVKLVRPEARVLVDDELELLPILEELDLDRGAVAPPVEDFIVWLDRQLDLDLEVIGLEQLAAEASGFDAFEIPTVLTALSGRDAVVMHRPGGTPLDELLVAGDGHRSRLARRLCQAWLQQSLLEGACPEGPLSDHLRALSNERFAISGGLVTTLDPGRRRHLLDAVIAAARSDPDRVCDALLAESTAANDAAADHLLRSELRQAETFRSAGWADPFTGRRIADTLFVYWRVMAEMGYHPKAGAIAFIRGFTEIEAAVRRLAPETDAMAGAIDEVRLVAAAVSIRERLGTASLIRTAEDLAPVVGEVLDHPDRWLRRFLRDDPDHETDRPSAARRSVSWSVFTGALAVLAAATIIGITAIRAFPERAWLEWVVALVFMIVTAGFFRLVGNGARR